jgi:hypothetical protein
MIVRVESNDEELELEPNDMGLILRDGHICLKSPDHEVGENVPEDFLVFVGIATVFHVEGFREQMLQIVQTTSRRRT